MKKLITILILFAAVNSFGQVRTFLGPKGIFIYDTAKSLNVLGTYLLLPNDSTLNFDSSKVVTGIVRRVGVDSFDVYKGGVYAYSIKDSTGGGSSGWALTGNAGTDTLLNFVGTTNNRDLYFRRNNVRSGLIDSTSGNEGHTSFGFGALRNVDMTFATVIGQTAYGYKALGAYTGTNNAGANTAIGVRALAALTTGVRNTAVGYNALLTIGTQSDNTAIGYNALTLASTSSTNNTAIGNMALDVVTSGTNNTGVGANAFGGVSSGTGNTGIGASAGIANTGDNNTAIGTSVFGGTGAGSYNVAVGWSSTLAANTSGSFNVAICRGALASNTTTSNSTAVGLNAGNLSTGGGGGFFGAYAGAYMTTEASLLVLNTLNRTTKANDTTQSVFYSAQNATAASQRTKIGGGGTVGINAYGTSNLYVGGSFGAAILSTGTGITLDISHHSVIITATGQTMTLPTAVGVEGRIYTIKLSASGTGTVATTSSQTIDGSTTYSLSAQYKYVTVQSDNANWQIIANN